MKIIKEAESGTSFWKHEVVCSGKGNKNDGCGSTLEIYVDDLFKTQSSSYDGSSESYITVECIKCKSWTDIPDKHIPSGLKSKVGERGIRYPRDTKSNIESDK